MDAEPLSRCRIIVNGGRAAGTGRRPVAPVINLVRIDIRQPLGILAKRTERLSRRPQFVVADDLDRAVAAVERGHAVGKSGDQQAVVHLFAVAGDDRIAEARRQVEETLGIRHQRTESTRIGFGRGGDDACRRRGGDGEGLQESAAINHSESMVTGSQIVWLA